MDPIKLKTADRAPVEIEHDINDTVSRARKNVRELFEHSMPPCSCEDCQQELSGIGDLFDDSIHDGQVEIESQRFMTSRPVIELLIVAGAIITLLLIFTR